jgi:hypothetical protein
VSCGAKNRLSGICVEATRLDVGPQLGGCVVGGALGSARSAVGQRQLVAGLGCRVSARRVMVVRRSLQPLAFMPASNRRAAIGVELGLKRHESADSLRVGGHGRRWCGVSEFVIERPTFSTQQAMPAARAPRCMKMSGSVTRSRANGRVEAEPNKTWESGWYPGLCCEHAKQRLNIWLPSGIESTI